MNEYPEGGMYVMYGWTALALFIAVLISIWFLW